MPRVIFARSIQRHTSAPPREVEASTVRAALDAAFGEDVRLRGYVLDDQQALRKHINVFIDGQMVQDRLDLSDAVGAGSEIYVLQALSGG